jgi:type VI secretion system protein ImpC
MSEEQVQTEGQAAAVVEDAGPSLLDEIAKQTKTKASDPSYTAVKTGVEVLLKELLKPKRAGERIDKALVDAMIAEIDHKMSAQLDEILHNEAFQKLESAWSGLKLLVDRTDFRENNKIEILNCSKEDLLADFEDAPEIPKSGMYKTVYSSEYGTYGGNPYGTVIGNYEFGPGPQDIKLLQNVAAVATMAWAPFIAAAGPEFFGLDEFAGLPNMKDLKAVFEGPQYMKWRSFRESEDARFVGLTLPRYLGRLPYGPETVPVKSFNYKENVRGSHEHYLWCSAAFAFATRLTNSFAKYRWASNVIGPTSGGAVEDLPIHLFEEMGETATKIPTEIQLTDRRELELAEEGFIPLVYRKGSDYATFFSASSAQKPKYFGQSKEGKENELNYKLGTQLPYMLMTARLGHYLKVLQREKLGSWQTPTKMQQELTTWINQYVNDTETPHPGTVGRRPLKKAQIKVEDVPGEPGWFKVDLKIVPHQKYMGADISLSLVGKLEGQ